MNLSTSNKNLSVFIPFYNEKLKLAETVEVVSAVLQEHCDKFEVILIDDGSHDGSQAIADDLCRKIPATRVVHLSENTGFGKAYLTGLRSAHYAHALYLTADGDVHRDELAMILRTWDGRRSLLQHPQNPRDRNYGRFLLSKAFTFLVNLITGRREPYYNGYNIYDLAEISRVQTDFGFCTQAYALLCLVPRDCDPIRLTTVSRYNDAESKALTFKNVLQVFRFLVYILGHKI